MPEELIEAMLGLAKQAGVKSWWHQYGDLIPKDFDVYVGLEAAAAKLTSYQPELIPGLLQTPEYDRELVRRIWPHDSAEEVEKRVQIKAQRQHIVTRRRRPVILDVVVSEAALRRVVGSPSIMAKQLRHLADMSTRENVSVRVLPFDAGFPAGVSMPPFVVLDFDETPAGVETEPSDHVGVRDSKNPTAPALIFTPNSWDSFTTTITPAVAPSGT
ncbi:DUF397 domain-containing protein [Nocardia sp. NPDC059180]|uniref:DUF397 domain-containing protein n=1 Tax=Nocardia sp. NPDC059180 TaxID=3346761 RepID=UPI0036C9B5CB